MSDWHSYSLYGLTLRSDLPFAHLLPIADLHSHDLTFTCATVAPLAVDWSTQSIIHTAPYRSESGLPFFTLYRLTDNCEVLRFAGVADFYLWPDQIACHLMAAEAQPAAELYLLGTTLAYWSEQHGIITLHGSAVVTPHGVAAFLAASGTGKSSLAASFMQVGYSLLSDDLLPLRRVGEQFMLGPGYPQIRLWPEIAERFLAATDRLTRVHADQTKLSVPVSATGFGSFYDRHAPVAALYLIERRDPAELGTAIEIARLAPVAALFVLINHCFATRLTNTAFSQRQRMTMLTPLARQIPVFQLVYPSGYEYLPEVRSAVLDHLARQTEHRQD